MSGKRAVRNRFADVARPVRHCVCERSSLAVVDADEPPRCLSCGRPELPPRVATADTLLAGTR